MVKNLCTKAKTNLKNLSMSLMGAAVPAITAVSTSRVFAAIDVSEIATYAIKVMAALAGVPGILMLIIGVIKYSEAHGEGDGQSENKARKQITAAIMMVAVAGILLATCSQLSGFISSAVDF